jgi:hypothetical protein
MEKSNEMEILYKEPGAFLGLSFSKELNSYVLHTDITSWSPSEFRRYLKIFEKALDTLFDRGITSVYGLCDTEKELKFNQMFGFVFSGFKATDTEGTESFLSYLEI